jgi:hypothetical protein
MAPQLMAPLVHHSNHTAIQDMFPNSLLNANIVHEYAGERAALAG